MAAVASSQPDLLSQITVDSGVLQRFFLSEKQARMTPFAGVLCRLLGLRSSVAGHMLTTPSSCAQNVKSISDLYIDAAEVLHKGNANTKVSEGLNSLDCSMTKHC